MRRFKIIFTSDVHGNLFARSGVPSLELLARCFQKDGDTLILDGGDILQGGTTGAFLAERSFVPNPAAELMNQCGYDVVTIGNHDTNFGLKYLAGFLRDFKGTCLCANLRDKKGSMPIKDASVFTLENGLRIGVLGITSPGIGKWETPSITNELEIRSAVETGRITANRLRSISDVVVAIYHGGFESDKIDTGDENQGMELCRKLDIDLLLTGHHHLKIIRRVGNKVAVQPGSHSKSFAVIQGSVEDDGKVDLKAEIKDFPTDNISSRFKLTRELASWENVVLGVLNSPLPARDRLSGIIYGSPLADFINSVQRKVTGADISVTHLSKSAKGLEGRVTVRDIFQNCYNANYLCVVECSGEVLKKAVEWSASAILSEIGSLGLDGEFIKGIAHLYHFDFFSGINYKLDYSRPKGDRIIELSCRGKAVQSNDLYSLCLSSYQRCGGDGYHIFKDCPLLSFGSRPIYSILVDLFGDFCTGFNKIC